MSGSSTASTIRPRPTQPTIATLQQQHTGGEHSDAGAHPTTASHLDASARVGGGGVGKMEGGHALGGGGGSVEELASDVYGALMYLEERYWEWLRYPSSHPTIYICICRYIHTYMHVYIYMVGCMYVCIYVCMYVYNIEYMLYHINYV
jgi:hypothetical protein